MLRQAKLWYKTDSMTSQQCRMARAGLGWQLAHLADLSGVNRRTIIRFEHGQTVRSESVEALRQCFAAHGVEFIDGGKRVGIAVKRKD